MQKSIDSNMNNNYPACRKIDPTAPGPPSRQALRTMEFWLRRQQLKQQLKDISRLSNTEARRSSGSDKKLMHNTNEKDKLCEDKANVVATPRVCLICRQLMVECCEQCSQSYGNAVNPSRITTIRTFSKKSLTTTTNTRSTDTSKLNSSKYSYKLNPNRICESDCNTNDYNKLNDCKHQVVNVNAINLNTTSEQNILNAQQLIDNDPEWDPVSDCVQLFSMDTRSSNDVSCCERFTGAFDILQADGDEGGGSNSVCSQNNESNLFARRSIQSLPNIQTKLKATTATAANNVATPLPSSLQLALVKERTLLPDLVNDWDNLNMNTTKDKNETGSNLNIVDSMMGNPIQTGIDYHCKIIITNKNNNKIVCNQKFAKKTMKQNNEAENQHNKYQQNLEENTTTTSSYIFPMKFSLKKISTFFDFLIQLQLIQITLNLFNWNKSGCNKNKNKNNNISRNNNNINNNNKKRQERPPLPPRLKFRRNSYTTTNTKITIINRLILKYIYNNYKTINTPTIATVKATTLYNNCDNYNASQQNIKQIYKHHHFQSSMEKPQYTFPIQSTRKMPNAPNTFFCTCTLILLFLLQTLPSSGALMFPQTLSSPQSKSQQSMLTIPTKTATSSLIGSSGPAPPPDTVGASADIGTALSSTIDGTVRLARPETVCKSMDIRNFAIEFNQLENCTVIEGFLLITLLDMTDMTRSFPLLTEVTDYIVVYRVHTLRSLSQIFPNLSIIRGRTLFEGYSLIVYSNPHIVDLGLNKLTTILRGGVRIEHNLFLCYLDTIDWTQIVNNTSDNFMDKNAHQCPQCPGDVRIGSQDVTGYTQSDLVCKEHRGKRHCWNGKACQKICPKECPNNCVDEKTCCNEACLGGCSPDNVNECISCRYYSINGNTCADKCPSGYYSYLDRRCITAEACIAIGTKFENNKPETLVPYKGKCQTSCEEGYKKVGHLCQKCVGKCKKECVGGSIDSVERAKELHGCTHIISEGLTISIKRGGRHLMGELAIGLSSIEVIDTFLKVHLTVGIYSLEFFKNLKVIKGQVLAEGRYALYVLENNDLESIWGPNQTVRIEEGRVFFHFNPKLCYNVIDSLRPMLKNNATFDKNEVATDSNGHKGSCNPDTLNVVVKSTSQNLAIVHIMNPLKYEDDRVFIGYKYFHIEDPYRNQTKYGHRPCEDGWSASDATKEIDHIFGQLEPFTQYAFYVKTMTISTEPLNAESKILYFRTKSAQPTHVQQLEAFPNSSSEIELTWLPPAKAYGNLTKYIVRAVLDKQNRKEESYNYCRDLGLKIVEKFDLYPAKKTPTEKPQIAGDCKCPKDGKFSDEDTDDVYRHDKIDFENTLQNFIYVKQPTGKSTTKSTEGGNSTNDMNKRRRRNVIETEGEMESYLMRHVRQVPAEAQPKIGTTTISPLMNGAVLTSESLDNETRMDATGEYYEIVVDTVNASTTKYVFQKLKHFSMYMLSVVACREPEAGSSAPECSDAHQTYVRTPKLDNVDLVSNLEVFLEPTNNSVSNLRLRWDPPERPNGAVVSYTISYKLMAQYAVEEKRCITDSDYRNMTNGYLLVGLQTGNYSIKVRANSLAGEGVYCEPITIDIPPLKTYSYDVIIISVSLGILFALLAVGAYCLHKRVGSTPDELKMYTNVNPHYVPVQYIPDEWEVPRDRVIQYASLGQGSFGMVYEGILKGYNNSTEDTPCAIKTVNENATDRERLNFLNEASVMKEFDTYHVVRLLGVVSTGQPALVIMELMKNGDLKSYLRAHRPDERDDGMRTEGAHSGPVPQPPPMSRIYQMAIEIADGMAYLAARKFVHRDLAARNCMVAADLTVKIGDFGMTRDIYETDYYRKGTKGLLPVRWMSPESLRDGVYVSSSDVFSYGVVLWEMITLASQPYQGLSNDQVLRYVIDGGVMERPDNCPDKLYRLMQRCWHHRPTARPTFMEIIRYLLDLADSHFREVSFYHSEEGQQVLKKELGDRIQNSGDIFNDNDNDMDDVTTPLRVGEYNDYKMNMENNSSVENHGDSPMVIDDDRPASPPYSLESAIIVSSTPDGQSKNSFNLSQMSHNNPTLSTAASTSAGAGGTSSRSQLHQPTSLRFASHTGGYHGQYGDGGTGSGYDESAYVQPDELDDDDDTVRTTGKSIESEERGYEIYDPSANANRAQLTGHHDLFDVEDEEDFDGLPSRRSNKMRSGHNLLARHKGTHRVPVIMPMSSSMPDEVSSAPISSSLHPSTASAASSNASSTTMATGKYPSLKRAVADTVQNVGYSLVPARFRNINKRFFNHKRTGSNASHKSTGSNPMSSSSNTNLTSGNGNNHGSDGRSMGGHTLGTIESGGSGSAGSYVAAPRFFTTGANDSPNYKLLDETANASMISSAGVVTTGKQTESATATSKPSPSTLSKKPSSSAFSTSSNPNYEPLEESMNTTLSPTRDVTISSPFSATLNTSENPNYQPMQPPVTTASALLSASENPNYVMMNQPQSFGLSGGAFVSENPNYQMMGPSSGGNGRPEHRLINSATSSGSGTSSEPDDDDHDVGTEHIKLERMPLSRRRSSERSQKRSQSHSHSRSRSRSQSQNKGDDYRLKAAPTAPTHTTGASDYVIAAPIMATTGAHGANTFALKEKWLKQHPSQTTAQPPPNGFIGREA